MQNGEPLHVPLFDLRQSEFNLCIPGDAEKRLTEKQLADQPE